MDFRLITFNSMTSKPKDFKYLLLIRSLDLEPNQQKYHNITQCERDHLRGVVSNHRAALFDVILYGFLNFLVFFFGNIFKLVSCFSVIYILDPVRLRFQLFLIVTASCEDHFFLLWVFSIPNNNSESCILGITRKSEGAYDW